MKLSTILSADNITYYEDVNDTDAVVSISINGEYGDYHIEHEDDVVTRVYVLEFWIDDYGDDHFDEFDLNEDDIEHYIYNKLTFTEEV